MLLFRWNVPLLLILIGAFGYSSANEGEENGVTYTIYASKVIRPGFDITLTASISNSLNPIGLKATFTAGDNDVILGATAIVQSGSSTRVVVGSLPVSYSGGQKFNLTVTGQDTITGETAFSKTTTDFIFESKGFSILIQTDKAIYQPGQLIQFRALCLTPDLKPAKGKIEYQVQDPNDNIVFLEPNAQLVNGVAGGNLQLTKDAVDGDWKITFTYQNFKESLPVTVQTYKLPKFEVELDVPTFVEVESPGFTVKVKATYTFGQPVSGSAKLTFTWKNKYGGRINPDHDVQILLTTYDGNEDVFVSMKEIAWPRNMDSKIEVFAEVTERLTDIKFTDTASFDIVQSKIKVDVLQKPEVIKPGLQYLAVIRVTEVDGNLLMSSDAMKNDLVVEAEYTLDNSGPGLEQFGRWTPEFSSFERLRPINPREIFVYKVPPNGIVNVVIDAKDDINYTSVSFRAYANETKSIQGLTQTWQVEPAHSPSNSFIQATATGDAARGVLSVGNNAQVLVRTTEEISQVRVMVIARGSIISDSTLLLVSKEATYALTVTSEMTPSFTVLVSYVRPENEEIVADYITLNADLNFQNQVTISTPQDTVDAGTKLHFTVKTSSGDSFVGLRAIDKSVLLLKSGNDITRERVQNDMREYSVSNKNNFSPRCFFCWFPYSPGANDAKEVFEQANIIVLTNALLYKAPEKFVPPFFQPFFLARGIGEARVVAEEAAVDAVAVPLQQPTNTRTRFPESWLWTDGTTNANGTLTVSTTAPDTITSWVISAFSMSDQLGLGIADTYKLTVFRNFFISLNLPLKITRGEIIIVQAIIFNYYKRTVSGRALIQTEDGVVLLRPGNKAGLKNGPVRFFSIEAESSISIKFPLRINKLGDVPIRVHAFIPGDSDGVVRRVFVRPEGIEQCYTTSRLFDINNSPEFGRSEQNDEQQTMQIVIPDGIIPGSEKATVHAYGDIMGSSMSNLGRLLRAPSGCGEQNMLSFAPDVFVTLYLKRVNQLDEETRKKAYQHIVDGYMNELNYKRKDGSFSAFGNRDKSGSTWLTAFVTKCFLFARELRPALVEKKVLDKAIQFMITQQARDGTFKEPGVVIHRDMQGGVNSPLTMTAYVLIALTETSYVAQSRQWSSAISLARSYLESHINNALNDSYALSLVTYALHVSVSSMASYAFNALNQLATVTDGLMYWHRDTPEASSISMRWRPPYKQASANDIEMTSYALLTYVKRGDVGFALPILKWLISKQNDLGGYSSTQDTVLAIQALSSVADLLTTRNHDVTLSFMHSVDGQSNSLLAAKIDKANAAVYQSFPIEAENSTLGVTAIGEGIAVVQLSVCYNIPEDPYDDKPFNCTVNVSGSKDKNSATVDFCCMSDKSSEETGMFLFEVGLLNGFKVDLAIEKERNKGAKMLELDDDSVNVYYDQLSPGKKLCANIELKRYGDVAGNKPATLSAFDYYKPDKKVTFLYNVDGLSETGPCEVCGSGCVGCSAAVLRDWSRWGTCVEFCRPEVVNRTRKCYDPNTQTIVPHFHCGSNLNPGSLIQTRQCKKHFRCPDNSEGLWMELPKGFPSNYDRRCYMQNDYRLPRSSSLIQPRIPSPVDKGLPGYMLDGIRKTIACYFNSFGSNSLYERALNRGFTLSLLIRPSSFDANLPTGIVYWQNSRQQFVVSFEHRVGQMKFAVRRNFTSYEVTGIPSLPINKWSHVVLSWNQRVAKVYINGIEQGIFSTISLLEDDAVVQRGHTFHLGVDFSSNNASGQAHFHGMLSALNIWSPALPSTEMKAMERFYGNMINFKGPEPELTVRQLRSFLTPRSKNCVTKPSTLSSLYNRTHKCREEASISPFFEV